MKTSRPKALGLKRVTSSAARSELLGKLNLSGRALVFIGIGILAFVNLAPRVQIWYEQRVVAADLAHQNEETRKSLIQMKEDLKRWDDPVYIRAQARDRLFYVMPGEISFTVMDAEKVNSADRSGTVGAALAAARNSTSLSKKVSTTKTNWSENLVETVVRAGLEQPKA
jgi:cell division protein FtsB